MLNRRESLVRASCAASLAAIGISPAHADPTPEAAGQVDRELRLTIGDGFTRQTWNHGGQVWTETRDTLSMLEDECVRVVVYNDTPGLRVLSFGGDRPLLRIKPGEAKWIELSMDRLDGFAISVVGQPAFSRPVKVRPSYGAHASVT